MSPMNGIISFGGTTTGGSSSTSGIIAINNQTGPGITILGGSGIQVTTLNNVITISASGTSTGTVNRFSATFINATDVTFNHLLNQSIVLVQVYDSQVTPNWIVPDDIILTDANNARVLFNRPQSGSVVILG